MNAPRADPTRFQAAVAGTTETVDAAKMIVRSIITTPDPDRAGDIVLPGGVANTAEFLANPVVLWAHQRTVPPIGICRKLDVQADRIVAETQFSASSQLARDVFRLYAEGVLRGWSIGFVPTKMRPRPKRGYLIEAWDLLEYSAVPVPENPRALTVAISKGLVRDARLSIWLSQLIRDDFSELLAG